MKKELIKISENETEKQPNRYLVTIVAFTYYLIGLCMLGVSIIPLMSGTPTTVWNTIFVYGWALIFLAVSSVCVLKGKQSQNKLESLNIKTGDNNNVTE